MRHVVIALLALLTAVSVNAAQTYQTGRVISLLADKSDFGSCMARLSVNLGDYGVDCTSWVTFDCEATSGTVTKSAANMMYQTAQLAFVTGKVVKVLAVDTGQINGNCRATRIKFE